MPTLLRGFPREIFLRQVYFTGIEALPVLAIAALLTGGVAIDTLYRILHRDLTMTLDVFKLLLVEEGSLILVSLYVLGRSGSAMAAEVSSMKLAGEMDAVRRLGLSRGSVLFAPRVFGCGFSVAALTLFLQGILVFGGFASMALLRQWDFVLALEKYAQSIDPITGILLMIRSFLAGMAIAVVACAAGIRSQKGPWAIPVATRSAVVLGFVVLMTIQFFFLLVVPRS
jgi:phospholipid/cholesterol/gamma-HCH transport system permease protein